MKVKGCKECEKCKVDGNKWCEKHVWCEKHYLEDYNKIYEGCKCCIQYKEERSKHFILSSEKYEKEIAISSRYHISKFLDLFNICEKDLEKFALFLRKDIIYYEHIDSQEKLKRNSLPAKWNFFISLNNKGIFDRTYKHAKRV